MAVKFNAAKKRSLRSKYLGGAATAMALLATNANINIASAQDLSADTETEFEEVIVTGSRIAKNEFTAAGAISTFNSEDIVNQGVTSVDEFLKDIPAFTGFQNGTSTNNGNDGAKNVDMRGIGFNRTLVLINGRRMVGGTGADGAVDLNTIPLGMIKRVEVLKDGASTIYGSDALAGVVNVILRDDFEGFEISADIGAGTREWDAANMGISAVGGVANDKGNAVFTVQYTKQNELKQAERDFSHDALYSLLQEDGSFAPIASGSSNSRRIRSIVGADGTSYGGSFIVDETTGQARPFESGDVYNYAPSNALITPNERFQFGANVNYELWDSDSFGVIRGYLEGMYTRRTSHQRLAPDASFGAAANQRIPASNPFNPFGDFAAGPDGVLGTDDDLNAEGISGASVILNRRFEESGGRLYRQSNDTFRIVAGLNGEIGDVNWDISYTLADTQQIDETKFLHRIDRWGTLVDPDACAADAACAEATDGNPFNPFAPYGSLNQQHFDYLMANSLKDWFSSRMELWQFNLSGDTSGSVELPGGPIGWAFGAEKRSESAVFSPDEFLAEGLTTSGAADPLEGGYNVKELYGELYFPILDNLSFETSARYSAYGTPDDTPDAGTTFNYKFGLNYAPIEDVRIRASYSTGFRAPNISELYSGNTTGFPVIESLCEFADRRDDINDVVRANCQSLIDDAGFDFTGPDGEFGFAWQSGYTQFAPEHLDPEKSKSLTVGAVFTPTALPGLQVSVDYWKIKIDNFIGAAPLNDLFRNCLESEGMTAPSCNTFDDLDGDGIGDPYNWIFPNDASGSFGNLGKLKTDGMDFNLKYDHDFGGEVIEGLTFVAGATWQMSREEDWPIIGSRDVVGTADGFAVFPEWRVNTSTTLHGENWSVTWDTRWIDKTIDKNRPASITDDAVAEAIWYHDIVANYTYEKVTFTVGVNNLFDKNPPRFHSAFNANTEPGVYDTIGRRLFANVRVRF